ncbi:AbrB family transcriptional regulator [Baekduia sp. Peel2402]|uniref:AbrB family transcriptional regulator n=1 Tax=Baekduia sp. Peel2402 TaxID=3458296 RepID=UPI00403ED5CB
MARWLGLAAITLAASLAFDLISLPSPFLFGALLVGLAVALARPGSLDIPDPLFTAAQALVGVALGAYLKSSSLSALGNDWLPVALVSAATLAVSLAAGLAMARLTELDRATAAMGMVAGGASGIVTMARDLGGDDRLVAFMQYLRVLVVVLLTPILVAVAFPGDSGGGTASVTGLPLIGDARDWLVTIGLALVGAAAGRLVRLPAGALLGPMILAGAVTLSAPDGWFVVPTAIQDACFAVIGLQVGLRFTVQTVRQTGRLLVPVLLSVLVLLLACFGLAILLDATTSVSLLDAYLATTPGGLYAVLAAAVGAGANTTFIVAVQGLRVVVMVLLAPIAVRRLIA